MNHKIKFPFPLGEQALENLENNLSFVDPAITNFEILKKDQIVSLELEKDSSSENVTKKVLNLFDK